VTVRRAFSCIPLFAFIALPAIGHAQEAERDEFAMLAELRGAFESGDYENCMGLAEQILGSRPSALVRVEAHQFFGASAELLGRTEQAEEQFEELLTLQPTFRLEQAEFPTEVLNLFETVRLRIQDRLRQIELQRERRREQERLEQEQLRRDEQERLARLVRPRFLVRTERRRHLALAFLPLGAGQFQNDQVAKGFVFLGSQVLLGGATMVLWLLRATMPSDPAGGLSQARELQRGYEIAGYAGYAALGVSVIWGIIDGLANFRRTTRGPWVELDQDQVEDRLGAESEDMTPFNVQGR